MPKETQSLTLSAKLVSSESGVYGPRWVAYVVLRSGATRREVLHEIGDMLAWKRLGAEYFKLSEPARDAWRRRSLETVAFGRSSCRRSSGQSFDTYLKIHKQTVATMTKEQETAAALAFAEALGFGVVRWNPPNRTAQAGWCL